MATCAACGHENPADARFCNACGAPLVAAAVQASRQERKTVSVVFVDLVGSTARAEQLDPEDVRAQLATYHGRVRAVLEKHGGTVEKFIGDAVVAVFGAPVAREDDPERAVRSALAVQEAIEELNEDEPELDLEVRVGVNTGEALVALDARPDAGEGMVSGDVINTAARLQSAAPPGGILVGEQTYRATVRVIDYRERPSIEAKGKAAAVAAWLALAPRSNFGFEDVDVGRAPLVGREREVALLTDALARVRRDQRPQLITLVGIPGIGKSRLVQELREIVDADPDLIVWRRGRSLSYGEGVPYWALGEIVKAHAGILESDGVEAATEKLASAVAGLLPEGTEAAWVERQLRPLVGISSGAQGQASRDESFAGWRRFLEALAEAGPTVLVFEDLHWADDDLLDFVDALVDELDGVPLLLVCTARPELLARRPDWGGGKLNALTLSLAPLSSDETARLLSALLDRSVLPAETQERLLERAAGVPLFAEEYARMLEADGEATELPETLHGLVAARVDGLPPQEKSLLQDAAVLGKVFWSDALGALSGVDGSELDESLRLLERREFVRRERRSAVEGARQYVFLHAIVREVAYGQIPRASRSEQHRRAAEWTATLPTEREEDRSEILAHHLASAVAYGEAAGLDVHALRPVLARALREAGDRAWSLNIVGRAERLYRQALESVPDAEPDPELMFLHGRALMWAEGVGGNPVHELERAIDGLAATGRNELAATAVMVLERYLWNSSVSRPELIDRARELVADAPPTSAKAEVLGAVAIRRSISGRHDGTLPLAEEALAIARAQGDIDAEGQALNAVAVVLANLGRIEEGIDAVSRSLELALRSGSIDTPRAYVNSASLAYQAGRFDAAAQFLRDGLVVAQRFENMAFVDWLRRDIATEEYSRGAWDEASELAAACLAESEQRGEPHLNDVFLHLLQAAIAVAREGVVPDGIVDEIVQRARSVGDPQMLLPTLGDAALVYADAGRDDEARALLESFVGRDPTNAYWLTSAAVAWARLRDDPFPVRLVRDLGTPWAEACLLIAEGEHVAAADVLGQIGARPLESQLRLRAATTLAADDPDEASRQLDLASVFWREVQAAARLAAVDAVRASLRAAAS